MDFIVALLVAATPAGADEIRLDVEHEGPLILGTVEEVPVIIHAPELEEERPLRVSVNVGSFGEVTRDKPGVYRSRYRLPATKHPQVALVAVWRETGPNAPITFLRIPLSGKTTLPVGTQRGSKVSVVVGEETFGPVAADRSGRAVVPIVVPPGVLEVVARSTSGSTESQKTVPVDLPPYNRLTLAVTPYLIEADGRSFCTAHVFYDSEKPPPIAEVLVTAPGGTVTPLQDGRGRYTFRYQPERGKDTKEVELAARVARDKTSSASTVLSLGSPVPQRLVIRPLAQNLVADGIDKTELQVLVMDKLGLGVPGRSLLATGDAGTVGEVRDLGEGRYAVGYVAPQSYPEGGRSVVSVSLSDRREVAAQIELPVDPPPWPAQASISIDPSIPISDGSAFVVDVTATDFAGRPFEQGVVLTASAAAVSEITRVGAGHYRARVTPREGSDSIELVVAHPSGRFSHLHRTLLRAPPPFLTIAAKVGGAYHSQLIPTGGLEVGFRPAFGERRFSLFVGAGYRQVGQKASVGPPLFASETTLDSRLRMVPITAGLTYDLLVGESWRFYLGAAFALIPFEHRVTTDLFETPTERDLGFGGEGTLGFEWYGIFVEATGGYTSIKAEDLVGPDVLVLLSLGYRLGVL